MNQGEGLNFFSSPVPVLSLKSPAIQAQYSNYARKDLRGYSVPRLSLHLVKMRRQSCCIVFMLRTIQHLVTSSEIHALYAAPSIRCWGSETAEN